MCEKCGQKAAKAGVASAHDLRRWLAIQAAEDADICVATRRQMLAAMTKWRQEAGLLGPDECVQYCPAPLNAIDRAILRTVPAEGAA